MPGIDWGGFVDIVLARKVSLSGLVPETPLLREIALRRVECPWCQESTLDSEFWGLAAEALKVSGGEPERWNIGELGECLVAAAVEYFAWRVHRGEAHGTTGGVYTRIVWRSSRSDDVLVQMFSRAFPAGLYASVAKAELGLRISHNEFLYAHQLNWPRVIDVRSALLAGSGDSLPRVAAEDARVHRSLRGCILKAVQKLLLPEPSFSSATHTLTVRPRGSREVVIAYGRYIDDGFVLLEGSHAVERDRASASEWLVRERLSLRESGKLQRKGESLISTSGIFFRAASTAAGVVSGGNSQASDWRPIA